MRIPENIKDGLNVVLNEASILELIFNENENFLLCKFELLRESGNPKSNIVNFKLENLKRYIATHTKDKQVLKYNLNQISEKLKNFVFNEIYGWEFFNVENFNFKELSFEYLKTFDYANFNSLELFQDDVNEDIKIKIWFESFKIYDENYNEINVENLIERQDKIWGPILKK